MGSLIDSYLPIYDVVERHSINVRAPVERVYSTVVAMDLSRSPVIRALFSLRELPVRLTGRHRGERLGLTIDGLIESGFIILAEEPNREFLLGLVGRFWEPAGGIQSVDRDGFVAFDRPGYAKAVWNFTTTERPGGATRLRTETRVLCLSGRARCRFRLYWLLVGPFSGLIRREMLRGIKLSAERQQMD